MKITRWRAAAMQLARFSDVRRSSSMIPIFTVFSVRFKRRSTAVKTSTVKATSALPCIFGFTT